MKSFELDLYWAFILKSICDLKIYFNKRFDVLDDKMNRISEIDVVNAVNKVMELSDEEVNGISSYERFQLQYNKEFFINKLNNQHRKLY